MIAVVALAGLATVQDGGRPGRMHEGVSPGGALVPEGLARANARARNAPGAPALELFGTMTLALARDAAAGVLVATDESHGAHLTRLLGPGERWTVATGRRRVVYAAVRGGIDVPEVLGGRGTLLVASLGGFHGRPLRKGDALAVGRAPLAGASALPPEPDVTAAVRVVPGPDRDRFAPDALAVLLGSVFVVDARSDRVGVRLVRLGGAPLRRTDDDRAVSGPMVRGAIQVPASGEPIVLGPDHPTTGGYPVLATVATADWGAVMARPVGSTITFATDPAARASIPGH